MPGRWIEATCSFPTVPATAGPRAAPGWGPVAPRAWRRLNSASSAPSPPRRSPGSTSAVGEHSRHTKCMHVFAPLNADSEAADAARTQPSISSSAKPSLRERRPQDIGVSAGRIATIAPRLVSTHPPMTSVAACHARFRRQPYPSRQGLPARSLRPLHGGLSDAIAAVAAMKRDVHGADVYKRGARVIDKAIAKGTTRMRTHVEVDPRAGFGASRRQGLENRLCLGARSLDLRLPTGGLTNDPEHEELLIEALRKAPTCSAAAPIPTPIRRRRSIGSSNSRRNSMSTSTSTWTSTSTRAGCISTRSAARPSDMAGAVGSRSGMSPSYRWSTPEALASIGCRLAEAGIALTVLPATDLYLTARELTAREAAWRDAGPLARRPGRGLLGRNKQCLEPFHPVR